MRRCMQSRLTLADVQSERASVDSAAEGGSLTHVDTDVGGGLGGLPRPGDGVDWLANDEAARVHWDLHGLSVYEGERDESRGRCQEGGREMMMRMWEYK